jgi:hypothetical protein
MLDRTTPPELEKHFFFQCNLSAFAVRDAKIIQLERTRLILGRPFRKKIGKK